MKMTKTISKKLIVSTLSTVMGVSLVGAITGTVAWYQYSTRSTVSFVGTTVGSSKNLLVSADGNTFKPDLKRGDLQSQNHNLLPVTTGEQAKDAALNSDQQGTKLFAQPIYQYFDYDHWKRADEDMFVQFPIYLKYNEVDKDGHEGVVKEMKNVYLRNIAIQDDSTNQKSDISDAIRVHLHTEQGNMLISKKGELIDVFGTLDLNNDGDLDDEKPAYDFIDHSTPVNYGTENAHQDAYSAEHLPNDLVLGTLFAKKVRPASSDQALGDGYFSNPDLAEEHKVPADTTPDGNTDYYVSQDVLELTVTIWLEGWQKLANVESKAFVEGYSFENLEYFTNSDLAPEHKVAADAIANGTTVYYVADAETTFKAVTPVNGQIMNSANPVKYYTTNKLDDEMTGVVPQGGATYFYNAGDSAMWDLLEYSNTVFDVGLLFEVEEQL